MAIVVRLFPASASNRSNRPIAPATFLFRSISVSHCIFGTPVPAPANVPARPRSRRAMEPRRLSGAGTRPLRTCHSPRSSHPSYKALTEREGPAFLAGAVIDNWYAKSLRGDKDGLGRWSEADIVSFLKTGGTDRSAAFGDMAEVVEHSHPVSRRRRPDRHRALSEIAAAGSGRIRRFGRSAGGTGCSRRPPDPRAGRLRRALSDLPSPGRQRRSPHIPGLGRQ